MMVRRDEELLADARKMPPNWPGFAQIHELRREVELLRLRSIDLAAENELLRDQVVQERSFIRAIADDVAAGRLPRFVVPRHGLVTAVAQHLSESSEVTKADLVVNLAVLNSKVRCVRLHPRPALT